jgi:putative PIN family toxin of toxin-antitoxin system
MTSAAPRIVVDTNVIAGALLKSGGANRNVLRACFLGRVQPVIGDKLFLEYEDVMGRKNLFRKSPLTVLERRDLFEAFLSVCEWTPVFFLWRPNLRDESDNHVLELAVAGGASIIVTNNVADFRGADLHFPDIRALAPKRFIEECL